MHEAVEDARTYRPAPLVELSTSLDPFRSMYGSATSVRGTQTARAADADGGGGPAEPEDGVASLELSEEKAAELARIYEAPKGLSTKVGTKRPR